MTTVSGGDKLEAYLASVASKVSNASALSVGFPGGATYPDGQSVAMVAAIDEFGAPSRGQPPRPFVRRTVAKHGGEWGGQIGTLLNANDMDAAKTLGQMGELIKGEIQDQITELADPPLAESTIKKKGFDKPLILTGQMLQSVDYVVDQ